MKRLIPLFITLISLPLSAQNTPTPVKPTPEAAKPKPTAKATGTSSGTAKSTSTNSRVSSRKVVLPPKSTKATNSAASVTRSGSTARPPNTSTGTSRSSGRRVVLPPTTRAYNRATGSARPPSPGSINRPSPTPPPAGLQENITIQLKGSTASGEALDLSLTGIGPVFQGDILIGEDATILTHSYSVVPHGPKYLVEFSIGMRIRHLIGANGPHKNFEFRDNSITGKVLLEPGKPVTVSNNQGKVLTLTVSKP